MQQQQFTNRTVEDMTYEKGRGAMKQSCKLFHIGQSFWCKITNLITLRKAPIYIKVVVEDMIHETGKSANETKLQDVHIRQAL